MCKADNLTTILCRSTKSGNLNFLEASGPLQARNRTALPVSTKLPKRDAFPNKWIRLQAEMDVIASSHASVDNGVGTHGVSSKHKLCDSCEGGSCGGNEEEEDKM